MRLHTRRVLIRESPGREPTPWVLEVDDEGISLRRLRHRERYTLTHARLLSIAAGDAASGITTPNTRRRSSQW